MSYYIPESRHFYLVDYWRTDSGYDWTLHPVIGWWINTELQTSYDCGTPVVVGKVDVLHPTIIYEGETGNCYVENDDQVIKMSDLDNFLSSYDNIF